MSRVVIIGAGGVARVVAKKAAALPEIFSDILIASRTLSRCQTLADEIAAEQGRKVAVARLDADSPKAVASCIRKFKADLVIHVALPYQDLSIMEGCLRSGAHYLDTANYESKEVAHFEYSQQWAYHRQFEEAGLMALLGCGFDPGMTGVYTAYAVKHHFDEIHYLDIVDCNAGDHGKAFATNFNPEINIREITQPGRYYRNGQWIETRPLEYHQPVIYPEIGPKESYLLYHEELESLTRHFPSLKQARFWMTFSENYLTHLRVLQEVGMTQIQPILFRGKWIQPLQFLKAVLPEPASLGEHYTGQTSIGCQIQGISGGKTKTYFIYNNCSHQQAFLETRAQGVSYTTGVPAVTGAVMMLSGKWKKPGVWNVEQFDPDPFMETVARLGLPWHEAVNAPLSFSHNESDL